MSLRILSGMVFVRRGGRRTGRARITFRPFQFASGSDGVTLRKRKAVGPNRRFNSAPATIVAARQFAVASGAPVLEVDFRMRINDRVTRDSITIRWKCSGQRVDQEEIPFMVIGEVPDPPVATPSPGKRPRGRRGRKA